MTVWSHLLLSRPLRIPHCGTAGVRHDKTTTRVTADLRSTDHPLGRRTHRLSRASSCASPSQCWCPPGVSGSIPEASRGASVMQHGSPREWWIDDRPNLIHTVASLSAGFSSSLPPPSSPSAANTSVTCLVFTTFSIFHIPRPALFLSILLDPFAGNCLFRLCIFFTIRVFISHSTRRLTRNDTSSPHRLEPLSNFYRRISTPNFVS